MVAERIVGALEQKENAQGEGQERQDERCPPERRARGGEARGARGSSAGRGPLVHCSSTTRAVRTPPAAANRQK